MYNPKVYVGSYGEYNAGRLTGGWVSLNECKDYAAFLSKCRAMHRGEREPEYMIQDSEDFPDGIDCMEWLSEQDFNDVKAACKEERDDAHTLSPAEQLRAILLGTAAPDTATSGMMYKTWLDEWTAINHSCDAAYYRKHYAGALKLHGGYYLIDKPRIENRFCFADEGPQSELYDELMADKECELAAYFKAKNLDKFDDAINHIEHGTYGNKNVRWHLCDDKRISIACGDDLIYYNLGNEYTLCTDDEKAQILVALKWGRSLFEKRLDSYLKRYGTNKLHTWTYWADA